MRTLAVVALLGLAVAFPLAAQTPDPVIDQAKALLGSNQAEKAVEVLEKGIAAKPNDAVRHYWLGSAYGVVAQQASMFKAAGLAGKVRDEFARAVQLDPNFIDARLGLMEFYLRAPGFMGGDEDKARAEAAEIKKRDSLAGHRAMATIAISKKDMNAARAEYAAAVRENPNSPKTHYWYAIFLMTGDKNYKVAGEELDAALRIDPKYMPATFQIGHLAALSGANLAGGEAALHKYIAYKPLDDEPPVYRAHYWLGLIYEKQGKKEQARAEFQTALKSRPAQKDVKEALKRVS